MTKRGAGENYTDAEATVDFCIIDAIASLGHIVRVPVGTEQLIIDSIKNSLFDPGTVWATKKYLLEKGL